MRIAMCFSGQPRFFEQAFPYHVRNLFDANGTVDVFMHLWHDDSQHGQPYDASPWGHDRVDTIRPDTKSRIVELYRPLRVVFEPQRQFAIPRDYSSRSAKTPINIIYSLSYSVFACNAIKSEYEQQNGFEYDWVFRCRTDYILLKPVTTVGLNSDELNLSGDVGTPGALPDAFAFGSSRVMNYYSEWHNNIDKYWLDGCRMGVEDLIGHHMRQSHIGVHKLPIEYNFIRKIKRDPNEVVL